MEWETKSTGEIRTLDRKMDELEWRGEKNELDYSYEPAVRKSETWRGMSRAELWNVKLQVAD